MGLFASPRVTVDERPDGTLLLRATDPLGDFASSMAHVFHRGAERHPSRLLAAQRRGEVWEELAWGEAAERAARVAAGLLEAGLSAERPLMILTGNSLAHLELLLAAYTAGIPVLPISPAYSLMSTDH